MNPTSEAHRPVVYVVDDESLIADTLAEILFRSGYESVASYCAEDALESALVRPPEMLITDVMLPGMNGFDLAVRMKRIFPECKIIVFSGNAASPDLLAIARTEGHEFDLISKPIHPRDLLARVEEVLPTGRAHPIHLLQNPR